MLDPQTLQEITALPIDEQQRMLDLLEELEEAEKISAARQSFMGYIHYMWPGFIEGKHHVQMAEAFDRVIAGKCKRLIINMGPRHTKSEFASKFLPSKYFGHYPDRKIIQATHTGDFSKAWGKKTRNLVDTAKYKVLFPNTQLEVDARAAGKWDTSEGGEYYAVGTGANLAGKGADLFIIDDPHSEQDYIRALGGDAAAFEDVFQWYQTGPRQRLQPGAAIVIVMTRWHKRDLTGKLIRLMAEDPLADEWEIIEFPAAFGEGTPEDPLRPLWPEFWTAEELVKTKASLSIAQWNAQYLQNPTSEEGALVKREWWRIWEDDEPPRCEYIIQAWDTAFTVKETSDFSACTTWGVFMIERDGNLVPNIILLDAYKDRLEFPQLKKMAYDMYMDRRPDAFVVEAKASGLPLIHELRRAGIPVLEYTPVRGTANNPNTKPVRVHAIATLFEAGTVWRTTHRWAEEVSEEFAAFPVGDHDDLVDSSVIALTRFREGGYIPLDSDNEDEGGYRRRTYSPY